MRDTRTALALLLLLTAIACSRTGPQASRPVVDLAKLHDPFDILVKRYVQAGKVDYQGWKNNPADLQALEDYLGSLAELRPDNFELYGDRKAFWVNAYNAFAIKLVLDRYPVKSVLGAPQGDIEKQLQEFFETPRRRLGSVLVSLNDIENEQADTRNNPLLNFVLVKPALSAPDHQPRAYRGGDLVPQLDAATRAFLANEQKGLRIDLVNRRLYLSTLFKDRRLEFGPDLLDFLRQYASPERRALLDQLEAPRAELEYLPFDWQLNDMPPAPSKKAPAKRPRAAKP